jgi:hypothetical protein
MSNLVRQDISLCELAGRAEFRFELIIEAKIDVDLLIRWTIERSRRRLGHAASRVGYIAKQDQLGVPVGYANLWKQAIPGFLRVIEDKGNELYLLLFCWALDDAIYRLVLHRSRFRRTREQGQEISMENYAEEEQEYGGSQAEMYAAKSASALAAVFDIAADSTRRPLHTSFPHKFDAGDLNVPSLFSR